MTEPENPQLRHGKLGQGFRWRSSSGGEDDEDFYSASGSEDEAGWLLTEERDRNLDLTGKRGSEPVGV